MLQEKIIYFQYCLSTNTNDVIECLFINANLFSFIVLLILIVAQLMRSQIKGFKLFSIKRIILSLLILEQFLFIIENGIYSSLYISQAAIIICAVAYVNLFYYFSCKIAKFSLKKEHLISKLKIWSIMLHLTFLCFYFAIVFEIASISSPTKATCDLWISNLVKILGGISTIIILIIAYVLEKKIRGKIKDVYQVEVETISEHIHENSLNQKEALQLFLIAYVTSQIIAMIFYIYEKVTYSFNQDLDCDPCQLYPCVQSQSAESILFINDLIDFILYVIYFFIPQLAILNLFWLSERKQNDRKSMDPDDDRLNLLTMRRQKTWRLDTKHSQSYLSDNSEANYQKI